MQGRYSVILNLKDLLTIILFQQQHDVRSNPANLIYF